MVPTFTCGLFRSNFSLPMFLLPVLARPSSRVTTWSPRPGLNWRPRPYQGRALPTELRGRFSRLDLTGAGNGIRTRDIQLGRLTLYQLSYSRKFRCEPLSTRSRHGKWRGVDSNHRRREPADLQSAPFGRSGTPPDLLVTVRESHCSWSWRWDSNPRPAAYKAAALPAELRQQNPSKKEDE